MMHWLEMVLMVPAMLTAVGLAVCLVWGLAAGVGWIECAVVEAWERRRPRQSEPDSQSSVWQ